MDRQTAKAFYCLFTGEIIAYEETLAILQKRQLPHWYEMLQELSKKGYSKEVIKAYQEEKDPVLGLQKAHQQRLKDIFTSLEMETYLE